MVHPDFRIESKAWLWVGGAAVVLALFLAGWELAISASSIPCSVVSSEGESAPRYVVAECQSVQRDGWDWKVNPPLRSDQLVYWSPLAIWGYRRTQWIGPAIWTSICVCAMGVLANEWRRHESRRST